MDVLRRQLGNTVNVEVDAAPGLNLGDVMNEMRQKYEVIAQKNLQEAKEQFERQVTESFSSVSKCVEVALPKEITRFLAPSFLLPFLLSFLAALPHISFLSVLIYFFFILGISDGSSAATSHSEH